jgi:hypothetical protein
VKEVSSNGWLTAPQKMNAFYTPVMNEIMIPLAIIQPPFFNADWPEVPYVCFHGQLCLGSRQSKIDQGIRDF